MSAADFVPPDATSIDELREVSRGCQGCHLYEPAIQTVFGAGPPEARVVLVGEQPGDIEDRRGAPFVGPAGKLLDRAIVEAGLDRAGAYVTNAVKHFKFRSAGEGKRRIHQTPDRIEIVACRPWMVAEFALLKPEIVVALGATAGKALLGPGFRVTKQRGVLMPWPDSAPDPAEFPSTSGQIMATIHPSAVLRADDRDAEFAGLVADLRVAARALG
jgi:DNA polymerase